MTYLATMKHTLTIILAIIAMAATSQPPIQYVNTLIGTAPATTESAKKHSEAGSELRGQTFPAVGRPFGMTQWTPETRTTEDKCVSPYYYNDRHITGFRGSHWMSGSCTQDYGSATLMPFTTGRSDTLTVKPVSRFNHKNETATPAYYRLTLDSYNIVAELTGSVRSGMMRFTYPGKNSSLLFIRANSDENEGSIIANPGQNEIIVRNPVHRIYQGWGQPAGFSGHFVIRFDKPFVLLEQLTDQQQMVISFGNEKVVVASIGTSFTSPEAARNNLEKELSGRGFEELRRETEDVWNIALGKIRPGGGSSDNLVKFYTALYHCFQLPRIVSDVEGTYPGFAQDTLTRIAEGFDYYDDFSMWDTYRALHPLLTIIEPERTLHMVRSLILKAEQGGWMPIFPAWNNYTAAMIGDHVSAMIADAYVKGIKDFDAEKAYHYMRKNAFEHPSREEYVDGRGRRALESYINYGYIPLEDSVWDAFHRREQVSRTLEYAFNDYAIAQVANGLDKDEDYDLLIRRSENWCNVFDEQTGYVRGRYADGRWIEPFDPFSKANFICEGTPFHYTWYVPHDIPGLISVMGGDRAFTGKLDMFFKDGHYWHGNEPGHQIPFLYTMAGRPDRTTEQVDRIIREEYGTGPGGLSGNEDAGQMSAWLVFSMMGFYPVCPATDKYIITTPAFDEIRIYLPGGNYFLISSVSSKPGSRYIRAITRGGGIYPGRHISHEDIMKGSRFTFQLTDKPIN
ncbi:MAG: GH92 family glycosyl hydrolase [Bacteroidales bacterium]